ncbi:MAG: magnesium and cobalt transport protein CorA, partial [Candidatus Bathyarchaeota archaeon]|nr:magnesium and cobalt transport protein CorA [Candidatus Bathyarchaeota archaeon]
MPKLIKRTSQKAGLPPGTLVHIGEETSEKTKITLLAYDELHAQEREVETVDQILRLQDEPTVTWINVDGIHQVEMMQQLGDRFALHPLVLEDILNTGQRPKIEDFGDYMYIVVKMFYSQDENGEIAEEQLSLILGPSFVMSFQEREGDVFKPIRERIKTGRGRIRKMGADYLAYALLDSVVDSYF